MYNTREHPRYDCGIEISIISNGHFFRDKLVDISVGGAQIELTRPYRLSRDVMIRAPLNSESLVALGDVRWTRSTNGTSRVGIQFLYLPAPMREKIEKLARN